MDKKIIVNKNTSSMLKKNYYGVLIKAINKKKLFNLSLFIKNFPKTNLIKRFSKINIKLSEKWAIIPSLSYTQQGIYRELNFGSSTRLNLGNSKINQALYFGVWNRNKDAAFVTLGYDYSNLFFGLSYDINHSKLVPASNKRGGVEISIRYIIHKFKPKQIIHRVCPDYI